ncbi:MAG: hypothetical protein LBT46_08940 [Planctomycetaceae bacterium]|jgi:hypothetical protein|nr:hypothetical protein [Planctomycetaceae bacterium]
MAAVLKAGAVAVEIIGKDANFHATLKRIDQTVNGLVAKIRNTLMASAAFRQTFAGITAPLTSMLSTFASFEAGMSKVKAITSATAEEIGKTMDDGAVIVGGWSNRALTRTRQIRSERYNLYFINKAVKFTQ